MIRSLVTHVLGWSTFMRFIVGVTVLFVVMDTATGHGFADVFENVLFGATMLAGVEYLVPALLGSLFSRLHKRNAMVPPCGQPEAPTAGEWHYVIIVLACVYSLVTASLALMSGKFSIMTALWGGVTYMAPWLGLILLVGMITETVHFLSHYREHRHEIRAQEQARDQARHDRETTATDQAFWDMVRNHKPDPGGVA